MTRGAGGALPGFGLPNDRKIEPARHAAKQLGRAGHARRQPDRLCRNPGVLDRLLEFSDRGLGGVLRLLVQCLDPSRRHLAGQHGRRDGVAGECDPGEMRVECTRQRDRIVDRCIVVDADLPEGPLSFGRRALLKRASTI
jgi:hypothetical protein